jgi:methyl-accepting chemotaxis protein
MIAAGQYIERASRLQDSSNQKLSTAIKVTEQVTEQLAAGATAATATAEQLEQVVNQLRQVVGK